MQHPARARLRHRDGVRRVHAVSRRRDDEARDSMELSLRWARALASARSTRGNPNALFGIVQGGMYERPARRVARGARRTSASTATRSAACRSASRRRRCCACSTHTAPRLPADKPRYLMGVGTPEDLVEAVRARHRHVRLRAADAQRAQRLAVHPLRRRQDPQRALPRRHRRRSTRPAPATPAATSRAPTCTTCSACNEILGARLNTIHNLHYYLKLMAELRDGDRRRHASRRTRRGSSGPRAC